MSLEAMKFMSVQFISWDKYGNYVTLAKDMREFKKEHYDLFGQHPLKILFIFYNSQIHRLPMRAKGSSLKLYITDDNH